MAAIATADDLHNYVANRLQQFEINRDQAFTLAAGQYGSLWTATGVPGTGATPGAAAVPTSATAGALANFANPGGGELAHLYGYDFTVLNPEASLVMYDRLVHHGGASGTDTSLVNVNTPAITRGDTNGVGAVGFVECYTQLGVTTQTLTVSYTNTAGTAARITTVTIPGTYRVGRLLPIPLLSGDFGIKSIETIQLGGSTGTAGSYGVTIARRICPIPTKVAAEPVSKVGLEIGIPQIPADACLWLVALCTSSLGSVSGGFSIITTG